MKNHLSFTTFRISMIVLMALLFTGQGFAQNTSKGRINRDSYKFPILPKVVENETDAPYTVIKEDFTITLRDGVLLDASKFYPNIGNPYLPNGYPTVIMVHGYGDRKETLENFARAQAEYNYVVYTYSVRGQGNSGGLSNLISRTEAQDLIEFVNYVKNDFATGLDTGKVLIMGGSQGGTLPYMAACMGMNVRTVISALTSPEFASSWIENGCVKMTFLWTIDYTPDTARYSPQVVSMRNWVYSTSPDKWDSLAYWLPYNRDFTSIVPNCNVPMLIENAWQDKFFSANGSIETIQTLLAPKKYYFGAVMGHGGDISPTEDQWHMNFFNDWFYYWLWDIDNGVLARRQFDLASTTFPELNNMWSFVHDSSSTFPPANMSNLKLYFNTNSKLSTAPDANNSDYVTLNNTVTKNYTLQQAVTDEFTGTTFNNKFKKAQLVFQSNTLTSDLKWLGIPTINIDYSSDANLCQYDYQIYEVSATKTKLVNRINYTDRKYTKNQRRVRAIDGHAHSHIFKAGNKIKIVLTNLDTAPDDVSFLGTNPHVLPAMTSSKNKLFLSNNCYINFPIKLAGNFSRFNVNDLFANDETKYDATDKVYKLNQNYPNPFNPTTNISFDIPKSGLVTLKIYDMAGREISSLVNNVLEAGVHNVTFNGANLSSGVYFYKLTADNYSEVKKMFIVK